MTKQCNVFVISLIEMIIVVVFQEYLALTKSEACHPDVWVNLACCYFFLGMYKEGDEVAEKGRC